MKKRILGLFVLFALLTLGVVAQDAVSETVQVTSAPVETHPSQGDVEIIEGGSATLMSNESGIFASMTTDGLEDGHVYTLWLVIINNPEACEATPCTAPEILGKSDDLQTEVTWGDGILISDEGRSEFTVYVPAGDVQEPWYGNGLTNPTGAEVHLVINDHGEVIPDMVATMLNTYRGGCADEGLPPPFPDTAKADGEPGPNTCRLVQDAIFSQ